VSNKTQRLLEIKNLIASNTITGQDELLLLLKKKGFDLTQATLSRDLKLLKVIRVMNEKKGYIYTLPENLANLEHETNQAAANGFVSIEFANQLAVIKTLPGFASSVAYAIDSANAFEILGTIAGDDTILLIPREGVNTQNITKTLIMIMPDIENKIKN
jgi:transcriptional regulator of arginine metabolism